MIRKVKANYKSYKTEGDELDYRDEGFYEDLMYEAVGELPDASETGITMGSARDEGYGIEYSVEVIFKAGSLMGEEIMAGGWVEIRHDNPEDDIYVTAFFALALNSAWNDPTARIGNEHTSLMGWYEGGSWDFCIEQI